MAKTPADSAHYHVSVLPDTHELRCRLRLRGGAARGRVRLEIPTWVPGDYSFFLLARDLFDVAARDTGSGAALRVTRDGWQAFEVHDGGGDITERNGPILNGVQLTADGAGQAGSPTALTSFRKRGWSRSGSSDGQTVSTTSRPSRS